MEETNSEIPIQGTRPKDTVGAVRKMQALQAIYPAIEEEVVMIRHRSNPDCNTSGEKELVEETRLVSR
jgi:hypothetical protein